MEEVDGEKGEWCWGIEAELGERESYCVKMRRRDVVREEKETVGKNVGTLEEKSLVRGG